MPEREAPHGWAVVVTTPPPSESFEVDRADTLEDARRKADEWGGGITWTSDTEGVAHYGERVTLEPARPLKKRRGDPLSGIRWDDIFETGAIEEWLGPELGLRLSKYGEVVEEDRQEFEKYWSHLSSQLLDLLTSNDIQPYSAAGGVIYPADVRMAASWFEEKAPTDPRDWSPAVNRNKAMAKALRKMLKDLG